MGDEEGNEGEGEGEGERLETAKREAPSLVPRDLPH